MGKTCLFLRDDQSDGLTSTVCHRSLPTQSQESVLASHLCWNPGKVITEQSLPVYLSV